MSYNVLIVDDSSVVRAIVRKSIQMSGIETSAVYEAANGKEALQILNDEWVDIVFADLNMPEMNGVELVEKMSEDNMLVSTPVVIISSEHREKRIEELKKRGIRAYMKKPFRPENFAAVVKKVLHGEEGGSYVE